MPKLTDTQLVMLSAAAQRADGVVELPENSKGAAAQKAAARLLREGLVEEVLAGRDLPAWRRDESDQPVALLITALGKEAIGVTEEGAVAACAECRRGGQALGQDPLSQEALKGEQVPTRPENQYQCRRPPLRLQAGAGARDVAPA